MNFLIDSFKKQTEVEGGRWTNNATCCPKVYSSKGSMFQDWLREEPVFRN